MGCEGRFRFPLNVRYLESFSGSCRSGHDNVADIGKIFHHRLMEGYSKVVAEGMKRVTGELSIMLDRRGFIRMKSARGWQRANGRRIETVHLQREGSSYGAPRTASVSLRLTLGIREMNVASDQSERREVILSDHARRPNGYAYHHRFNAATGSTYERCLEELDLYLVEVAEPWFAERQGTSPWK